ncbi:gamma-glutamylcyclotransferase family protein [Vibrio sp. NTOU-M3]|uniref:gamma-glutamylcyclotransferase family protein n=1 Tax=Vibrio sp. NTOU-M3 TaxID=3234954 RepID=UPI00349F3B66
MPDIFVFGTLKQGFPNFNSNAGQRITGRYKTRHCYPLYLVGERHSPWMVLEQGKGFSVVGEIYQVDKATLTAMDKLERVGEADGYRRVTIEVTNIDNGDVRQVDAYLKPREQMRDADIRLELEGEYLLEHAALYRSRSSD